MDAREMVSAGCEDFERELYLDEEEDGLFDLELGEDSSSDDDTSAQETVSAPFETERLGERRTSFGDSFHIEEVDEMIVDSFNEHYSDGWKMKAFTMMLQFFLLAFLAMLLIWMLQGVFPELKSELGEWATWADATGAEGAIVFAFAAGVLMLIPGVPGSLLCFTCGTVFPFGKALFIAAVGHHLGACFAFGIARLMCRNRFEKLLLTRPTLKTMSIAAKSEQWKVTFLSRFIVMPVQVKNYLFGVLPVSFSCFFLMAFLGDFQSTLFSVYLGSVSQNLLDDGTTPSTPQDVTLVDESSPIDQGASWIPLASLVLAVVMTTVASLVARKAYLQVLYDIKKEKTAAKEERTRRRSLQNGAKQILNKQGDFANDEPEDDGEFNNLEQTSLLVHRGNTH